LKNEALEDLWRRLNQADIEGDGATPNEVKHWLSRVWEAIDEQDDLIKEARREERVGREARY